MGSNGCTTGSNVMNNGLNGYQLLIWKGCRTSEQWVEQRLSQSIQQEVLEMSNNHIGAHCVVTASNGIPLPLKNPLDYIN